MATNAHIRRGNFEATLQPPARRSMHVKSQVHIVEAGLEYDFKTRINPFSHNSLVS